jgi:phage gpG-like protein
MPVTFEINDASLNAALARLQAALGPGLAPVLQHIGDEMVERIRARFASSSGPEGEAWPENTRTTLLRYAAAKGGFKKNGLNRRGRAVLAGKKPLIGVSRALSSQTVAQTPQPDTLLISNPLKYAAVQQFGAQAHQFGRAPWGNIPPRRFLPITADGMTLTPAELRLILSRIEAEFKNATSQA